MKVNRIVVAVLAAIVILPVTGNTQEVRSGTVVRVSGARGFIGVQTVEVRAPGSSVSRQRAVVDVVAGSPAERAGVVRGDTILRINGAAATAAVMATPYEPGDTITLRVRRNGRERDVKLVAGERPAHSMSLFNGTLVDAEINERINIIRARIHADLDTAHIRTLHITTVRGDSTVVVFGRDTIRTIAVRGTVPLMLDSLHATLRLTHDTLSVLRLHRDSIFTHLRGIETGAMFRADSALRLRLVRPSEVVVGGMIAGLRAVAGAELHDLNADLAASFGATRGVLVLNAREGTPAARAGLRGGDVILRANGTDVSTIAELRRVIESAGSGSPVQLRVLRRGQNIDIALRRE